jgi:hypothetical protein
MKEMHMVRLLFFAVSISLMPSLASAAIIATAVNPANGHTYHLLTGNSWTASEAEAIALGGHLATINDAAENLWVFSTFSPMVPSRELWIGLNDAAIEGSFVWASGQAVTYTNWGGGEPNNNGNEDYAVMYGTGQWNDSANTSDVGKFGVVEVATSAVPEPSTLIMFCVGAIACAGVALRRRRLA